MSLKPSQVTHVANSSVLRHCQCVCANTLRPRCICVRYSAVEILMSTAAETR